MGTKKRILVFVPEFPVLTETFIERELAKLSERGDVDLTVFSLCKSKGALSDVLCNRVVYQRINLVDFFKGLFFFILNLSKIISVFFSFLESLKKDRKKGIDIKNPGFSRSIYTFLKSCIYAEKFSHLKPDFILAHFFSEPSTMVMHISNILGIPYGISAHAKDILVTSEYPREKIKTAKFITICNENAYKYVLKQAEELNKSNIFLSYHGVDVSKILRSFENKDYRPEKPIVLAVGRLVEKKGLGYLIKSAKILKDRGSIFELDIVGSGPLYENLVEEIKKLGLENDVKILGQNNGLSNEDTLLLVKSASVFAFPSVETEEGDVDGVANVLLEAGVFKLPVVATNAGGTQELIVENQTGLIVNQRDSEDLANKLELLLLDRDLSQRLGEELHKKVLEKFSLDKNIIQLEKMLLKDY